MDTIIESPDGFQVHFVAGKDRRERFTGIGGKKREELEDKVLVSNLRRLERSLNLLSISHLSSTQQQLVHGSIMKSLACQALVGRHHDGLHYTSILHVYLRCDCQCVVVVDDDVELSLEDD